MTQVMKKVHLTQEGLEDLKTELNDLLDQKRPKAVDRVARARDFGDLSENSEYHQARDELAFIDGRIEELQDIVNKAVVVGGSKKKQMVDIGSKVTVIFSGKKHTYTIVGEWEADPKEMKISHKSPLGKALFGKKVGDEVEFVAPAGKIIYKIHKID